MREKRNGFTLLELLVVVAIIGLLASIVLVGVSKARANARDAKRQADIMSIVTGIELYYNSNGYYPFSAPGDICMTQPSFKNCTAVSYTRTPADVRCYDQRPTGQDWLSCFLETDIAPVSPHDPLENQGKWRYAYYYSKDRATYNVDYYPDDLPDTLAKAKCPDGFQKALDNTTRKVKCLYSPKKL